MSKDIEKTPNIFETYIEIYKKIYVDSFEKKFNASQEKRKLIEYELLEIEEFEKKADVFFRNVYKSTNRLYNYQTLQDCYKKFPNGQIFIESEQLEYHVLEFEYLRLVNGYYNQSENRCKTKDTAQAEARYFLFKDYLLKKLQEIDRPDDSPKEHLKNYFREEAKSKYHKIIQLLIDNKFISEPIPGEYHWLKDAYMIPVLNEVLFQQGYIIFKENTPEYYLLVYKATFKSRYKDSTLKRYFQSQPEYYQKYGKLYYFIPHSRNS